MMTRSLRTLLYLSVMLLSGTSATEINETTTFYFETTEIVTESSSNEGATVATRSEHAADAVESKEESSAVEHSLAVGFPDNHRNLTAGLLGGNEILFPYHNPLVNNYQEQYKAYLEQKQLFNRKPIKFEENPDINFYISHSSSGLDIVKKDQSYQSQKEKKQEMLTKPFPYVFEQDKVLDLYKNAGFGVVRDEPKKDLAWRDHLAMPQFISFREHPHEEKLYKMEPQTYVHQPIKKSKGSSWKKALHLLTALVPLGLILASLTPNVISVNSTAVTKNTRQRSEDSQPIKFKEEDVIELMNKFGVLSLSEAQCEDRIVCELARRGNSDAAGSTEKKFWFLANETPWNAAEREGLNDLFRAIKTGACESYKCHSKAKPSHLNRFRKKLIKTRKTAEK